jgi:hypothetical protein
MNAHDIPFSSRNSYSLYLRKTVQHVLSDHLLRRGDVAFSTSRRRSSVSFIFAARASRIFLSVFQARRAGNRFKSAPNLAASECITP